MFKILTIPFDAGIELFDDELLNNFCLNKKIKNWKAEFFKHNEKPCWTVFLEYDPLLDKGEPKEQFDFNEKEKLLFERLRTWRKERAEKEGLPVYIIATNRELKNIIKTAPVTSEALKAVQGFGRKKIEKYGKEIISLVKNFHETEER